MYKLVMVDDKEFEEQMKRKVDSFNDTPEGWTPMKEREMAKSMFMTYAPDFIEFRQIKTDKEFMSVWLYHYYDGTGIGIRADYWKGKMMFWKFGCDHDYHGLSQEECRKRGIFHGGNCYHVEECKKCKFVNSYDSSD